MHDLEKLNKELTAYNLADELDVVGDVVSKSVQSDILK